MLLNFQDGVDYINASWLMGEFFYYSSLSPSFFTGNGESSFSNSGHDRYGCNNERKKNPFFRKRVRRDQRLLSLNTLLFLVPNTFRPFSGKRVKELILIWWKTKIPISSTLGTTKERGESEFLFSMKRVSLHFPQNFEEKKALFVPEKSFPFFFFSCIVTLMKCAPIKRDSLPTVSLSLPHLNPNCRFSPHYLSFPTSFRSVCTFSLSFTRNPTTFPRFFHFSAIRATKTMSRLVYIGICPFLVFLSGKMHFLFLGPFFSFGHSMLCPPPRFIAWQVERRRRPWQLGKRKKY